MKDMAAKGRNRNGVRKWIPDAVKESIIMAHKSGLTQSEVARRFSVHQATVCKLVNRRTG